MPAFVIDLTQDEVQYLKKKLGITTDGELRQKLQWQIDDVYGLIRNYSGLSLRDRKQLEDKRDMQQASRIRKGGII